MLFCLARDEFPRVTHECGDAVGDAQDAQTVCCKTHKTKTCGCSRQRSSSSPCLLPFSRRPLRMGSGNWSLVCRPGEKRSSGERKTMGGQHEGSAHVTGSGISTAICPGCWCAGAYMQDADM